MDHSQLTSQADLSTMVCFSYLVSRLFFFYKQPLIILIFASLKKKNNVFSLSNKTFLITRTYFVIMSLWPLSSMVCQIWPDQKSIKVSWKAIGMFRSHVFAGVEKTIVHAINSHKQEKTFASYTILILCWFNPDEALHSISYSISILNFNLLCKW